MKIEPSPIELSQLFVAGFAPLETKERHSLAVAAERYWKDKRLNDGFLFNGWDRFTEVLADSEHTVFKKALSDCKTIYIWPDNVYFGHGDQLGSRNWFIVMQIQFKKSMMFSPSKGWHTLSELIDLSVRRKFTFPDDCVIV